MKKSRNTLHLGGWVTLVGEEPVRKDVQDDYRIDRCIGKTFFYIEIGNFNNLRLRNKSRSSVFIHQKSSRAKILP